MCGLSRQTGFTAPGAEPRYNYAARRAALRATWFPGHPEERAWFESEHSVVLRFIIGSSANASDELALQQEEQEHGDFMRLPLQEDYRALPNKTRTFFRAVTQQWDPDWVIKMDDDVYLNTARLLDAARQWDVMGAQYVGCMKHGVVWRQPGALPVEAVSGTNC
ncbi:hypothetical protein OEZ85_005132 [Tetradesmus obliquus]|uniref:Hexosyltransferase n=1 Tax=Tetradesmus obliquus TaxID=3088 RepID=A0ABY8UJC4_TETOB|nr:hypothetical protein OEZ85_005132 [Tetradesmus obliquus]